METDLCFHFGQEDSAPWWRFPRWPCEERKMRGEEGGKAEMDGEQRTGRRNVNPSFGGHFTKPDPVDFLSFSLL